MLNLLPQLQLQYTEYRYVSASKFSTFFFFPYQKSFLCLNRLHLVNMLPLNVLPAKIKSCLIENRNKQQELCFSSLLSELVFFKNEVINIIQQATYFSEGWRDLQRWDRLIWWQTICIVKYCKECKLNKIDLLNRNKTHKWVVLWINESAVMFQTILWTSRIQN